MRAEYFSEAVREAAIARGYLRPEMVVADIGTGAGFIAAGLAPLVSRVYALNGSAAMLQAAREHLAAFANIVYGQSAGHVLPLPDASLDAAFANMYLHHCPDPLAALREMVRVLKPGGRLAISDMVTDRGFPRALQGDPRAWTGCISGALPEREYLDLVAAAGFTEIQAARSQSGGRAGDVSVYSLSVTARK